MDISIQKYKYRLKIIKAARESCHMSSLAVVLFVLFSVLCSKCTFNHTYNSPSSNGIIVAVPLHPVSIQPILKTRILTSPYFT